MARVGDGVGVAVCVGVVGDEVSLPHPTIARTMIMAAAQSSAMRLLSLKVIGISTLIFQTLPF
jgi:hypothetical protein